MRASTFVAVACITVARAHIALWDKSMFGLNYPNQVGDAQDWNNAYPVHPLREADGLSKDQWFAHGYKGFPPKDGDFMVLPAGGYYTGEQACNRAETSLRDPTNTDTLSEFACRGGEGALHTMNRYNNTNVDPTKFGGTALAIAYTSDVAALQPNDMTVISVVQSSVWTRSISYAIPAGLPACPPGGCLCTWNWIHRAGNGEGYPFEIYNLLYRCTVSGASSTANVVQRGQVPKDCTGNPSACLSEAKTPMYLYQADGNNLPHLDVPPMYNPSWGFSEGAQNDIFAASNTSTPAPTTYIQNPYASTTSNSTAPEPTATALPQGWQPLGCFVDQDPRALNGPMIYSGNDVTISMGTSLCDKAGYKYAMIENGNEIWCGNAAKLVSAPPAECNVRCKGDVWAYCGGPWRGNAFVRVEYEAQNTGLGDVTATGANSVPVPSGTTTGPPAPSSTPTEVLPAGWVALGCSVDQDSPRVLDRGAVQLANNTNPICANYCASQNYTFAGTQYGAECWCGVSSRFVAGTSCDKPCAGDSKTLCGGGYRINVMQFVGTAASPTAAPTVTPAPTSSANTTSVTTSANITETATGNSTSSTVSLTPTTAVMNATSTASVNSTETVTFTYVPVTNGTSTVTTPLATNTSVPVTNGTTTATTSLVTATTAPGSNTTTTVLTPLAANTTAPVVSSNSTSSKTTAPATTSPLTTTPLAATTTTSSSSSTTTTTRSSTTTATTTAATTTTTAKTTSIPTTTSTTSTKPTTTSTPSTTPTSSATTTTTYAVVTLVKTTKTSSSSSSTSTTSTTTYAVVAPVKPTTSSTTTSTSSTTTTAVGPTATVANVLPKGWVSLGCFVDSSDRVLPAYYYRPTTNSPSFCINLCSSFGYAFAGVESKTDCGCSNSTAKLTRRLTTCTMPCPADKNSTCGGTWAIEVFSNTTQKLAVRDTDDAPRIGRRVRNQVVIA